MAPTCSWRFDRDNSIRLYPQLIPASLRRQFVIESSRTVYGYRLLPADVESRCAPSRTAEYAEAFSPILAQLRYRTRLLVLISFNYSSVVNLLPEFTRRTEQVDGKPFPGLLDPSQRKNRPCVPVPEHWYTCCAYTKKIRYFVATVHISLRLLSRWKLNIQGNLPKYDCIFKYDNK